MDKLISFIIPCYNAEKTIDRCLKSIANQITDNIEIIAVDDNSTDRTIERLQEWKNKLPLKIVHLMKHSLQGKARNIALSRCKGEYIGFIDADDYLAEGAIDKLVEVVKRTPADVINYLYMLESAEGISYQSKYKSNGLIEIKKERDREDYFKKNTNIDRSCWNKLMKRELVKKYRMRFAEGVYDEESLYLVPAFLYANSFYNLNEYLYHYCMNEDSSCSRAVNNLTHQYDNEKTWEMVYDYVKESGGLKEHRTLFTYFYVINYYFYSIKLAECRGVPYHENDLNRLKKNVIERFPDFKNNRLLK